MTPTQSASSGEDVHVFSVSELNRTVRDLLESGIGGIWVEGEISNLARPASGHMYFSLKDTDAQVRCAMFRGRNRQLEFNPEAGLLVRAWARVSLYEARGEYQLVVERMQPSGAGALARAFEELKRRLAAEGLFASERRRPLPTLPHRIGVITSPTGAAIRDVLHVLRRRFPAVPIVLYPVPVQGDQAAAAIARMLARAGTRADCDVLLLVRGGGSLEDLWPFNEEVVARAIVACAIPVVSGVGHEVDVTIADFAADQRAPTPSAAAELVVPDATAWLQSVAALDRRLRAGAERLLRGAREHSRGLQARLERQHPERRLQQLMQRRDELALRLVRAQGSLLRSHAERLHRLRGQLRAGSPRIRLERAATRLQRARERLAQGIGQDLRGRESRLQTAVRALDAVSPLATLGRGYALVLRRRDGHAITDATQADAGDSIDIRLARGRLDARVTQTHAADDD